RVVAAGGMLDSSVTSLNSAEAYYPETGVWSGVAPMQIEHGAHSANNVTIDGHETVLVIGGENNASSTHNTATEYYDPGLNTWTLKSMLQSRAYHASATLPN